MLESEQDRCEGGKYCRKEKQEVNQVSSQFKWVVVDPYHYPMTFER